MTVRKAHGVAIAVAGACLIALLLRRADPASPAASAPVVASTPPARSAPTTVEPAAAAEVPAPPPVTAPSSAPRTTIAVLRVGQAGERVELVSWATKPIPCSLDAAPQGATSYVLEDARTGARLAAGPCALPRLCPCPGTDDHRRGCLRLRHEAVVRLKLPRVAPAERLTILGPDGPIATFALEGA